MSADINKYWAMLYKSSRARYFMKIIIKNLHTAYIESKSDLRGAFL